MTEPAATLIELNGIVKLFYTDAIETHALSDVHLMINRGEYVAIAGRRAAGRQPCSLCSACSTPRQLERTASRANPSRDSRWRHARKFGTADSASSFKRSTSSAISRLMKKWSFR